MRSFNSVQNYDIGLLPNDWNATPVSTSSEHLYTLDICQEELVKTFFAVAACHRGVCV